MKTFTIENETNNITLHLSVQNAKCVPNAECFSDAAGLAKLAATWPAARLVEIWNSLPGAVPVRRFKDRRAAAARIWQAIQTLHPQQRTLVPEHREPAPATHVAPSQLPVMTTRKGSKAEAIIALMNQPGGTTLKAIMEATTWQAHSVRGFISGTLGRKLGLSVISAKSEKGNRNYSLEW